MADEKLIFKNIVACLGEYRISARANQVTIDASRPAVDASALDDKGDRTLKGTFAPQVGFSGHSSSTLDQVALQEIESASGTVPFTALLKPAAVAGDVAAFGSVMGLSYQVGGPRGETSKFTLGLAFDGGWIYFGTCLENQIYGSGFSAGANNGSWVQLTVPSATEEVVAAWHLPDPPGVTTGGGETYDGHIEVASDGSGTGAETILTFSQLTAAGSELKRVAGAGPAGKDFYRSVITPTGGSALCHPVVAVKVRTTDGM